jgi:hypothetical protein
MRTGCRRRGRGDRCPDTGYGLNDVVAEDAIGQDWIALLAVRAAVEQPGPRRGWVASGSFDVLVVFDEEIE